MGAGHTLVLAIVLAVCSGVASAQDWSADKIDQVTHYMRQYRKDWSPQMTVAFLSGEGGSVNIGGPAIEGGTSMLTISADDGRKISLVATGKSLLVNGKDVTGNLGSKITYGSNSPIIDNIKDSQIAAGSNNSVSKGNVSNFSLTISLSFALSMSVILNTYLLWKMRRRSNRRQHSSAQRAKHDAGV